MSVKEYIENDQVLYAVKITLRSKKNREVRVQKSRMGIKTQKEAQKVEKSLLRSAHEEMLLKDSQGQLYGVLVDEWELALRNGIGTGRTLSVQTQQDYVNILRNFTSGWWSLPANQVTPADVRDVLVEIHQTGKSRARQQRVKTAIDNLYKWGIETRKISILLSSPSCGVSLIGKVEEKCPEILNINEIKLLLKLAKEMNHRWYPIWAVALLTGCRAGELYALQWCDIDFENKRITISKSFNKRTRTIGPTKSRSWREVPISSQLEILLKELKLKRSEKKWVLPHHPEWSSYQQAEVLRQFCREIGIPSIRFHALRACFATQLLKDSIAPSVVMKVCGWKDLKTMQHYIRLSGIEILGATDTLKILPDDVVMGRVMELFSPS